MYENIQLTNAAKAFCPATWQWDNKGAQTYEFNLWLVLQGQGHIKLADGEYPLQAGDCFVLRDWLPSIATHNPDHPLVVPYILYEYRNADGNSFLPPNNKLPAVHRHIHDLSFFSKVMDRCIWAHQNHQPDQARHWLLSCLTELVHQDSLPIRNGLEREQYEEIETICESIRKNLDQPVRVAELAEECGYSTDHFIRLFRKYAGTTPCEFYLRARTQAAFDLLRFSSQSITQIAQSLGYGDIFAFSRQFSQRTGKSPSAFRKGL